MRHVESSCAFPAIDNEVKKEELQQEGPFAFIYILLLLKISRKRSHRSDDSRVYARYVCCWLSNTSKPYIYTFTAQHNVSVYVHNIIHNRIATRKWKCFRTRFIIYVRVYSYYRTDVCTRMHARSSAAPFVSITIVYQYNIYVHAECGKHKNIIIIHALFLFSNGNYTSIRAYGPRELITVLFVYYIHVEYPSSFFPLLRA